MKAFEDGRGRFPLILVVVVVFDHEPRDSKRLENDDRATGSIGREFEREIRKEETGS